MFIQVSVTKTYTLEVKDDAADRFDGLKKQIRTFGWDVPIDELFKEAFGEEGYGEADKNIFEIDIEELPQ